MFYKIIWVCICACIHIYVCVSQTRVGSACDMEVTGRLWCPLLLISSSSSCVWAGIRRLCGFSDRLVSSKPWQPFCLFHPMHLWGYRLIWKHLASYVGTWDPSTGLDAYTASIPHQTFKIIHYFKFISLEDLEFRRK